jgi:hypothetical protein
MKTVGRDDLYLNTGSTGKFKLLTTMNSGASRVDFDAECRCEIRKRKLAMTLALRIQRSDHES